MRKPTLLIIPLLLTTHCSDVNTIDPEVSNPDPSGNNQPSQDKNHDQDGSTPSATIISDASVGSVTDKDASVITPDASLVDAAQIKDVQMDTRYTEYLDGSTLDVYAAQDTSTTLYDGGQVVDTNLDSGLVSKDAEPTLVDASKQETSLPYIGECTPGLVKCDAGSSMECNPQGAWVSNGGKCDKTCVDATYWYVDSTVAVSVNDLKVFQRKASKKKLTWEEAKVYCDALGKDWRLPEIGEINKLKAYVQSSYSCIPAFDQASFPNEPSDVYWSASRVFGWKAWVVSFNQTPYDNQQSLDTPLNVRCIKTWDPNEEIRPVKP